MGKRYTEKEDPFIPSHASLTINIGFSGTLEDGGSCIKTTGSEALLTEPFVPPCRLDIKTVPGSLPFHMKDQSKPTRRMHLDGDTFDAVADPKETCSEEPSQAQIRSIANTLVSRDYQRPINARESRHGRYQGNSTCSRKDNGVKLSSTGRNRGKPRNFLQEQVQHMQPIHRTKLDYKRTPMYPKLRQRQASYSSLSSDWDSSDSDSESDWPSSDSFSSDPSSGLSSSEWSFSDSYDWSSNSSDFDTDSSSASYSDSEYSWDSDSSYSFSSDDSLIYIYDSDSTIIPSHLEKHAFNVFYLILRHLFEYYYDSLVNLCETVYFAVVHTLMLTVPALLILWLLGVFE